MQYHIQTGPIWDAFNENDGCPLCKLYARTEKMLIRQYLNEAVMAPDFRVRVNKRGFCAKHLVKLYNGDNKLGVALQLGTRTSSVISDIGIAKNAKTATRLADKLDKTMDTCVICDEIDETMERYAYTIAQMYCYEDAFAKTLADSYGFCMPHFSMLLRYVKRAGKREEAYSVALTKLQSETLRKANVALDRFTQRFDYRADKLTTNEGDALAASINKLKGELLKVK